jgi:hypothetical protein
MLAPSFASSSAWARPSPLAAPVMTATLPYSDDIRGLIEAELLSQSRSMMVPVPTDDPQLMVTCAVD